jgi:hypothetical protein
MKNKQTAVEWLVQQLYKAGWEQLTHEEKMNMCCSAKLMEKEQIIDAYYQGDADSDNIHVDAEQYYNETYSSGRTESVKSE